MMIFRNSIIMLHFRQEEKTKFSSHFTHLRLHLSQKNAAYVIYIFVRVREFTFKTQINFRLYYSSVANFKDK